MTTGCHRSQAQEPGGGLEPVSDAARPSRGPQITGEPRNQIEEEEPLRRAQLVEELLDRRLHAPPRERAPQQAHQKEERDGDEQRGQVLWLRHARMVAPRDPSAQEMSSNHRACS